jgi:hypothetical protein
MSDSNSALAGYRQHDWTKIIVKGHNFLATLIVAKTFRGFGH